MKTNPLKKLLRDGRPTFGTMLSLGDLAVSRSLARAGFDWLILDLEHNPIDWSQASAVLSAIADAGCVPIARVPSNDYESIKRTLDAGAWGIMVPMVDTVEEAQRAIAAAKYPPLGNRSLGGTMHALNFQATSAEYYARANDEIVVVLQTESPRGVENAEAIYALPGVDAIFVGPNDLRAQMRRAGQTEPTDEEFESLIARVVAAGKKTGTATGMHTLTPEAARARVAQGMRFIAVATDLRMLVGRAEEILMALKTS